MADFNIAYKKTMLSEGDYSNHPADRGGETYRGISRRFFPKWKGWELIDSHKEYKDFPAVLRRNSELERLIIAFYKEFFWDCHNLSEIIEQGIADEVFDVGVNLGRGVAGRFLQEALNLTNRNGSDYPDIPTDGIVGPLTIKTVNRHKRPGKVLLTINCLQAAYYIEICRKDRTQEIFFMGWLERVMI